MALSLSAPSLIDTVASPSVTVREEDRGEQLSQMPHQCRQAALVVILPVPPVGMVGELY